MTCSCLHSYKLSFSRHQLSHLREYICNQCELYSGLRSDIHADLKGLRYCKCQLQGSYQSNITLYVVSVAPARMLTLYWKNPYKDAPWHILGYYMHIYA